MGIYPDDTPYKQRIKWHLVLAKKRSHPKKQSSPSFHQKLLIVISGLCRRISAADRRSSFRFFLVMDFLVFGELRDHYSKPRHINCAAPVVAKLRITGGHRARFMTAD